LTSDSVLAFSGICGKSSSGFVSPHEETGGRKAVAFHLKMIVDATSSYKRRVLGNPRWSQSGGLVMSDLSGRRPRNPADNTEL
jgi:hypothetical protein